MPKQELSKEKKWYVIHTYAGYEERVAEDLKQRVKSFKMEDKIFNVIVPKEKKIKIRAGKRYVVEEKIYPGYVLVEMIVTDESWYVVRNTPHVTGFVGAGIRPFAVSQPEIERVLEKLKEREPEYKFDLKKGDLVKIIDGSFKDFEGKVDDIDEKKGKIRVWVNFFGRDTSVELDFLQVRKL
ncbi:MAG: transcription termination/antitermination protein NusG [Minisyncoccales bacterium]